MNPERQYQHLPVLMKEVLDSFRENLGSVYVDCTLGGGGHASEILALRPAAKLYAFDRDGEMIAKAQKRFEKEISEGRLHLVHGNYGRIRELLAERGVEKVDGILVDAGVSSFQLDQPERGFSFLRNGPLDMRMDQAQALSAREVVNEWSREKLEKIFFDYGEEKFSRKIVGRILEARDLAPISDTATLSQIIERAVPRQKGPGVHLATRVFQAIRIAVNGELEGLEQLLAAIPEILNPGGVFSAISFHSLEDRLVKERLRYLSAACVCPPEFPVCACGGKAKGFLPNRRPILASEEEIASNPRSRSAKLRVFVKA
jgi:16S rRNA (cytosine1402-N4)-methyltransferase